MLKDRSNFHMVDKLFQGLVRYPTEASAMAVAAHANQSLSPENAMSCLREMSATAETALIKLAPSTDNTAIAYAALEMLGDCGTEKCQPLLRKGMRSPDPRIRQVSKDALGQVKARIPRREAARIQ